MGQKSEVGSQKSKRENLRFLIQNSKSSRLKKKIKFRDQKPECRTLNLTSIH